MNHASSIKKTILSYGFTLAIVCYHANIAFEGCFNAPELKTVIDNIWEYLANIAMAFFFMSSGFLLYNKADSSNITKKLSRRIYSIVIPFLVWNTLYYILSVLQNGFCDDIATVIYRFTFYPYDGPLWYLFAITMLSLVAPLVLRTKDSQWLKIFIIVLCVFAVTTYSCQLLTKKFDHHFASWVERLCRYFPSYTLGAAVALYRNDLVDRVHLRVCGFPFVLGSGWWIVAGGHVPNIVKWAILFIMPVLIWSIDAQFTEVPGWMRNSFIIYAIHRLALILISAFVAKLDLAGRVPGPTALNIVYVILPFLSCCLIWLFVDVFVKGIRKLHLEQGLALLNGGRE